MKTSKQGLESLMLAMANLVGLQAAWASRYYRDARERGYAKEMYQGMASSHKWGARLLAQELRRQVTPADWRVVLNNARFACRGCLKRGGIA